MRMVRMVPDEGGASPSTSSAPEGAIQRCALLAPATRAGHKTVKDQIESTIRQQGRQICILDHAIGCIYA